MTPTKKIFFASDFHLGVPNHAESLEREKRIVKWLEKVKNEGSHLFLLGDVFDFWFEYKRVAPRGYVRLLGKLAELSDAGIKIEWFTGNHDMWIFDYLPKEIGFELHRNPVVREFGGKRFYLGHGDGLGPGDKGYKFIKKVFSSRFCQWCFARLHPNFGIWLADYFSGKSRLAGKGKDEKFFGEKEWLVIYCRELLKKEKFDYFLFGHRHLPIDYNLGESRYLNLGEWVNYSTYAEFDGKELSLKEFKED